MGLLRTILIILLVYFGFKILARLFAPLLLKFVAKKAEEKFGGQFGGFQNPNQQRQEQKQKEGETIIDKMPNNNSSSNQKVGEYIDYEEIDE
ncbi:DUF4834 family protein [Winogradskyella pacifica]|uniref:Uncharacterized protein DUF4834 n=1 Tax=Winogradskyella pacifica TaxID=664642 RepID=A0A3D9N1R6_9FLAO|nr:DUF4834 family protein [Winogradskyella pacifica]REE25618.1 uncharacterized protein DUF4834 [Winogradskyella pacifica]